MDFDHRDRALKIKKISWLYLYADWSVVLAEVAKCDLVCACCHRLRTYKGDHSYHTRTYKYHRAIVDTLKERLPCADCGRNLKSCQMDFDHVAEKTTHVSWLLRHTLEELRREVAKCHLVCANCHRVRTNTNTRQTKNGYSEVLLSVFDETARGVEYPADLRLVREWHALVGTMSDAKVAVLAGVTRSAVSMCRRGKSIPSFRAARRDTLQTSSMVG
jgi:hypothetical protein